MAKKPVYTLEFTPDYTFHVIAIFCAYRDYKLCFEINRKLFLGLQRFADKEILLDKKGSSGQFPYFFFLSEDEEEYYLIENRAHNGFFLVPEMRQTDYFLVIKNPGYAFDLNEHVQRLNSIKLVSRALSSDPKSLKSAENFLVFEPVKETMEVRPTLPPLL